MYPTGARDLYEYSLINGYFEELKAMGVEFDGESWAFAGQGLFDSDFNGSQFIEQQQGIMEDLLEFSSLQPSRLTTTRRVGCLR